MPMVNNTENFIFNNDNIIPYFKQIINKFFIDKLKYYHKYTFGDIFNSINLFINK
jgi:hypothetical protein